MFKRYFVVVLLSLVARLAFPQCGIERWPVKVGADSDIAMVNTVVPLPVTIGYLHGLAAPRPLPQGSRIAPVETTTYSVTATLVEFKLEDDSDYHLVLTDDAGRMIVAELPSSGCSARSPLAAQIATARATFDARFHATSAFQRAMVPVEVRGVGFFDFLYGQTGAAPNGIELHPVTYINFSPLVPATAPPPPRRRASVPNPRPVCPLATVTLQASRTNICPGETATLTWQASDPKASVGIDGVGSNLPSSGSTTVGTTYSLAYSARATNSCGTGPEAVAVVNVQSSASGSIAANPSSIQQNGSATVTVTTANASSWTVSSSLGNTLNPSSGNSPGTASIAYTGLHSGTDMLTLTINGGACGAVQRSATIIVNSTQPVPVPPPIGNLRCCDGTLSPTCTSCANKQGCCSHHGGVCGCP